mgnify:CR=1 FL=1
MFFLNDKEITKNNVITIFESFNSKRVETITKALEKTYQLHNNQKRKGTDVTIVSFGKIMKVAFEAADILAKENISAEIIDLRTIRPIDYTTVVNSIKKTNRCVVLEESWPLASISSEIAYHLQRYAFDYLDAPVQRVTQTDTPFAFSPTLIDEALPNVDRLIKAVKATLYR